jgi:hypothetical protein
MQLEAGARGIEAQETRTSARIARVRIQYSFGNAGRECA